VPSEDQPRIESVAVRVGEFSGVVPEALEFALEVLTADSDLAHVSFVLEQEPTRLACNTCGAETVADAIPFLCEECGSIDVQVTSGADLTVQSVSIADAPLRS